MRHFITSLLFMLCFFGFFFAYPNVFMTLTRGFFFVMMGIAGLVVLLVAGSIAWKKFAPASFAKSGIKIGEARAPLGFVGSAGIGSRVRIEDSQESIRVEMARVNYAIILLAMGLFGPGIILLYIWVPEKFDKNIPMAVICLVVGSVAITCYAFIRILRTWLWERPALQITASSIELLRGKETVRTLWQHQLKRLFVQEYTYHDSEGYSSPNYILAVQLGDDSIERLCIAGSKEQIEYLLAAVSSRMGIHADITVEPLALPASAPKPGLTPEAIEEARGFKARGAMIEAIKLVRERTTMGLKEAKDYVESL